MGNYYIRQITGLTEVRKEDGADLCGPLLSYDEEVILSFKSETERVFFTSKRIVIISLIDPVTQKKEYLFAFYSRMSAVTLETCDEFDTDTEVKLWVPEMGIILLSFTHGKECVQIAELIGSHTK